MEEMNLHLTGERRPRPSDSRIPVARARLCSTFPQRTSHHQPPPACPRPQPPSAPSNALPLAAQATSTPSRRPTTCSRPRSTRACSTSARSPTTRCSGGLQLHSIVSVARRSRQVRLRVCAGRGGGGAAGGLAQALWPPSKRRPSARPAPQAPVPRRQARQAPLCARHAAAPEEAGHRQDRPRRSDG